MLPFVSYIAVFHAYNKLNNESELIIFKATGLRNTELVKPVAFFLTIIILVNYSFSLYIAPTSFAQLKSMKATLNEGQNAAMLKVKAPISIKNYTIYVDEKDQSALKGILIQYDDEKNPYTIIAESGYANLDGEVISFKLYNGRRYEGAYDHGIFVEFGTYEFELQTQVGQVVKRVAGASELSTARLVKNYINAPDAKLLQELNGRLCWPLYSLIFAFISIAAQLKFGFSKHIYFKKFLLSFFVVAVLFLIWFILNKLFSSYDIWYLAIIYTILLIYINFMMLKD